MIKIDIKSALKYYKEQTGETLTIGSLSKITGIPRNTISHYINREPSIALVNIKKISEVTGYPLDKIIINDKNQ